MDALFGVVNLRRWSEPHVVVQICRDRLLGIIRFGWVDWQADLHARESTDATAPNEFAGLAKLFMRSPRTLLAPDLQDATALCHCVAQDHAFRMRHGEWLLEIYILACAERTQRHLGMLMVGQADHDRIDVLAGNQLAVVAVRGDLRHRDTGLTIEFLDESFAGGEALRIEVADGDDIRESGLEHAGHDMRSEEDTSE